MAVPPPQFSSVQSLSRVRLFATLGTAARQASLSITNSWSPPKLMSIESVMPSNHLILCRPLLLLPPVFPSTRVFSSESALRLLLSPLQSAVPSPHLPNRVELPVPREHLSSTSCDSAPSQSSFPNSALKSKLPACHEAISSVSSTGFSGIP